MSSSKSDPERAQQVSRPAAPPRSEAKTAEDKPRSPLPQPTLPKGGGALAPIGEKFTPHPQMGTGSMSIPVPVSPGRGGFGPKLPLTYDSGAGNSVFGLGWNIDVPSISRRTDRGLPLYNDDRESDTFILSGSEDLVRVESFRRGVEWITRYRPRVESAFARIERRVADDGRHYWVSFTRDNVRSVYGFSDRARVVDPTDSRRIFRWLLEWSDDDRGNVIAYYYKSEDDTEVGTATYEMGRARTNRYLKAIGYLNETSRSDRLAPATNADVASWPMLVLFDYGEHDATLPSLVESRWPAREDSFSHYRAGFEIRTHRLCRNIYMLHKFESDSPAPIAEHRVVRSLHLDYNQSPSVSYLKSATTFGWRWNGSAYDTAALPAVKLTYEEVTRLENLSQPLPLDLASDDRLLVDFEGEGLPGLLQETADGGWWYARPEGQASGLFAAPIAVAAKPAVRLRDGWQLHDLNGDGLVDAVHLGNGASVDGFYERSATAWRPHRAFDSIPHIDWSDPSLRFADLDGDGFPDAVITDRDVVRWHRNLTTRGYGEEQTIASPATGAPFREPLPLFAQIDAAVVFADMTGDGLPDVVLVRASDVRYWPNLGYGRFGQVIVMELDRILDSASDFEPRRVHFADIDGTGTADLLYFESRGCRVWRNGAGNRLSAQPLLSALPPLHRDASVQILDLFGTGTATIAISQPRPLGGGTATHVLPLLPRKPHLLRRIDNGFGAKTTIEYASSTAFYLADRNAGRGWATKLPFPVQCVASIAVEDEVARTVIRSTFRYHHGYYDGAEREFRGFGMVETIDSETISGPSELFVPPVITKTWFHTGSFSAPDVLSRTFADEYWDGDSEAVALPDSVIVDAAYKPLSEKLLPDEEREARRALRGRPLRVEVYASDDSPLATAPFAVTETNYSVRVEQRRGSEPYSSFSVFARETLTAHYERRANDPRIAHELTLSVGAFGDVERVVAIGYPRRAVSDRRGEQDRLWSTHTASSHLDPVLASAESYRGPLPDETKAFELVSVAPKATIATFEEALVASQSVGRLLKQSRARYCADDGVTLLPPHEAALRALPAGVESVAWSRALLGELIGGRDATVVSLAEDHGGYSVEGDSFWAMPIRATFDPGRFFLPISTVDPFGGTTTVDYDELQLLPKSTMDAAGNATAITNDYRLLAPRAITDPNLTAASVETDVLGIVRRARIDGSGQGGVVQEIDYAFFESPTSPAHVTTRATQTFGGTVVETAWVYSDGSGREAQRKIAVEPGVQDPEREGSLYLASRFASTGKAVFNNKGLPVKRYEPYFSGNETYDPDAVATVAAVLHYDPIGRLIRTDFPNGTHSRVDFDAWRSISYDENDTLVADTPWYHARSGGTYLREPLLEQDAAAKAFALRDTPTTEHADSLGRSIAVVHDAGTTDPKQLHETSSLLDCEGNVLTIFDAQSVPVAKHTFDLLGRRLSVDSVDAGWTWVLPDALGNPIYQWRAEAGYQEAFRLRLEYDKARRLVGTWEMRDGETVERLRERVVYRDADGIATHSAGRVYAELDGAGMQRYDYDFRGNVARSVRHVLVDPAADQDWAGFATFDANSPSPAIVDVEELIVEHDYDAQNRERERRAKVGSRASGTVFTQRDRAGQIAAISADLPTRGATDFVKAIEYDAKGRRHRVTWGHDGITTYSYDHESQRLLFLQTEANGTFYQKLVYAYDAVGNITSIRDDAHDTNYFNGTPKKPLRAYTYDALYRLREARGREHLSQAAPEQRDVPDPLALPLADANDLDKIVEYIESYKYDPSGNIESFAHKGASTWQRDYTYVDGTNRLETTKIGTATSKYGHDRRGNMTSMAHLETIGWTHRDEMRVATRTRRSNTPDPLLATAEHAPVWFAYDPRGQRVRKTAISPGSVSDRIYLGGFEIYRERGSITGSATLERETLHVLDGERRVALVETRTLGADGAKQLLRYQHDDHLGSAVVELSETRIPLTYEEFHPYGTTALFFGLGSKRYRFTGMERDEETGLQCHGVRYYAVWLARWTSVDSKGIVDGTNLFRYVRANPIVLTDRTGHKSRDEKIRSLPGQRELTDDHIRTLYSKGFEKALFEWASGAFTRHLRGVDAAEQERYKKEGGFHPYGYYQPLFDKDGTPNDFGKQQIADFRSNLRGALYIAGDDPVRRIRGIFYELYRDTSGLRQKQELLAMGIVASISSYVAFANVHFLRAQLSGVQGVSTQQFEAARGPVLNAAEELEGEAAVHGSRASGTARPDSDVDIAIRVSEEQFDRLIQESFGAPNEGSAKLNTMLRAMKSGKIQAGELGLSDLRLKLEDIFKVPVDISAVKIGGAFDQGPYVPFR